MTPAARHPNLFIRSFHETEGSVCELAHTTNGNFTAGTALSVGEPAREHNAHAPDAESAIKAAIEEFKIDEAYRGRLIAQPLD
jgi:hypothetical protein